MFALGITLVIVQSLTVFAFQTKCGFTIFGGTLFVALGLLIMFGIIFQFTRIHYVHMISIGLCALILSIYLICECLFILI